jgi:hypothetical protein
MENLLVNHRFKPSPVLLNPVPLNAKVNGATPAVGLPMVPLLSPLHVASVATVVVGVTGVVTSTVLVVTEHVGCITIS